MDDLLQDYNNSITYIKGLMNNSKIKLEKYEKQSKETKAEIRAPREPDEDGWITVRHKGGRDPTRKLSMKAKSKKKAKKEKKIVNFYAFEIRESKLKRHQELLAKFEEDKKRLAQMRGQRKFKI